MDQWIQQLRSPNPDKRKEAIVQLANTKDVAVLKYLKYVYENDPDPQIRQVAAKAGAFVQKNAGAAPDPAPTRGPQGQTKSQAQAPKADQPVSAKDKEKAKQMVDRAVDYHMRGDKAKTIESLRRAIQLNRDLKRDRIVIGLASDLFGRRPEEAVEMLFDEQTAGEVVHRARKQQTNQNQVQMADDMNAALTYVAMYGAVYFIGFALLLIMMATLFLDNLPSALPTEDQQFIDNFKAIGPPLLILIALIYAVIATLGHLASTWAIHTVAKYMMVGSGNFFGFLRRYTLFQTVLIGVMFASYGLLLAMPAGETLWIISFALTIGGLYAAWYTVRLIAGYYNIGNCAGCMSIIGGGILLSILYALFGFFFQVLLGLFS